MLAIANSLLHLIIPNNCALCKEHLLQAEQEICNICWNKIPITKLNINDNLIKDKFIGRVNVQQAHAFTYIEKDNSIEKLLYQIKYNNRKQLAVYMATCWGKKIMNSGIQADAIIPIPLSDKKEYLRGYNQSLLLAEGLSKVLQLPIYTPLKRVKNTTSQTTKNRIERLENIQGAFEWKNNKKPLFNHPLIIDDVITTGATIEIFALKLLEKYPKMSISVASLAVKA